MIEEKLWKMMMCLEKSYAGRLGVKLLYGCGAVYIWNELQYKKDAGNPVKDMLDARDYFKKNKRRIGQVVDMLADEKSKQAYLSAIEYRKTHDRRDRPQYSRKDQYFPKDIVKLSSKEVFIDCGAYNGDTIAAFQKNSKNRYRRIVAFEPDKENAQRIRKTFPGGGKIVIKCTGVWSEGGTLLFADGMGSSSHIAEEGKKIKAAAIDEIRECRDATFIKMDIEGSEYEALLGAEKTIKRNCPKLAVCIYHSHEDMIRIPELIGAWNLDYDYFVRHHAQKTSETVFYCIPKQ